MKLRNHSRIATFGSFLKDIIDKPSCYRVVVFCSYGSISTPGKGISEGTPTDLRRAACMTLWPRKGWDGTEVNDLLLDWAEFNEVVLRFNDELAIDPGLSRAIFDLTAGHVGAICELLRVILDKVCFFVQCPLFCISANLVSR